MLVLCMFHVNSTGHIPHKSSVVKGVENCTRKFSSRKIPNNVNHTHVRAQFCVLRVSCVHSQTGARWRRQHARLVSWRLLNCDWYRTSRTTHEQQNERQRACGPHGTAQPLSCHTTGLSELESQITNWVQQWRSKQPQISKSNSQVTHNKFRSVFRWSMIVLIVFFMDSHSHCDTRKVKTLRGTVRERSPNTHRCLRWLLSTWYRHSREQENEIDKNKLSQVAKIITTMLSCCSMQPKMLGV